uniref:Uncharacterized protein n=1 Tax=Chromera velia CCMP2878 TaxID=1169474 RepID=A0A0G4FUL2_9ALVE|eukprot:Cvel_18862.t1-p1 / transcript=Cvel_18862.t1 / gene=Cvel_18862 / organism=Chromera_velia_CCMP2878 / gene_product=hypothetical protein / transcript_product=hypothetical protein / location=Cvel_scaffold1587:18501-19292(+) / protein_length=264 / sequence_SO=supercontig / SO=protein_coding / is_pseudo=false
MSDPATLPGSVNAAEENLRAHVNSLSESEEATKAFDKAEHAIVSNLDDFEKIRQGKLSIGELADTVLKSGVSVGKAAVADLTEEVEETTEEYATELEKELIQRMSDEFDDEAQDDWVIRVVFSSMNSALSRLTSTSKSLTRLAFSPNGKRGEEGAREKRKEEGDAAREFYEQCRHSYFLSAPFLFLRNPDRCPKYVCIALLAVINCGIAWTFGLFPIFQTANAALSTSNFDPYTAVSLTVDGISLMMSLMFVNALLFATYACKS